MEQLNLFKKSLITTISCPNCKKEMNLYEELFDENIDELVVCNNCNYKVSKWCYTFVSSNYEYITADKMAQSKPQFSNIEYNDNFNWKINNK